MIMVILQFIETHSNWFQHTEIIIVWKVVQSGVHSTKRSCCGRRSVWSDSSVVIDGPQLELFWQFYCCHHTLFGQEPLLTRFCFPCEIFQPLCLQFLHRISIRSYECPQYAGITSYPVSNLTKLIDKFWKKLGISRCLWGGHLCKFRIHHKSALINLN